MNEFITLVQGNGLLGLITGLVVLVAVYLMSTGGVVVTQGQKQSANVVLSILLAGVSLVNPESADVVVGAIASFSSALMYEGIRWLLNRLPAKG